MLKRIGIACINVIFPPLGVLLLCGPETDMIINCILFICAVIPSHFHGFYISMTYFNRKRKVRKGQYPGDWRRGIYSQRVQYGGASRSEYLRLKSGNEKPSPLERQPSRSEKTKQRIEDWDDGFGEKPGNGNGNSDGRTSIYTRPQGARRHSATRNTGLDQYTAPEGDIRPIPSRRKSGRRSGGPYEQDIPGDNERPVLPQRQPSRRAGHDLQDQSGRPPVSRTASRRSGDYDSAEASPILSRAPSGRRAF